jgi:fused signal recognition particle receptor
MGLLSGLGKTRESFFSRLKGLITLRPKVNDRLLESLEELLIQSDIGVDLTLELTKALKERVARDRLKEADQVVEALKESMKELLPANNPGLCLDAGRPPAVYLVVGVNGSGKTTTIGKMARFFKARGQSVTLAACDTFRAAAIEQLAIWAERSGSELVRHKAGADPAAVAFDALSAAKARSRDVLIIDTAGRLHTKSNLMTELKKIGTVLLKGDPGLFLKTLLVLDGTNGQNSLEQAREFHGACPVDGLVITKLDGTARGGFVFPVRREISAPVVFLGTGEQATDLEVFDTAAFVDSFFHDYNP